MADLLRAATAGPYSGRRIANVSSLLAELIRNRSGRHMSPISCAALFGLFVATLTLSTAYVISRWGSPLRWPRLCRAALVTLSVGGSVAWWWIDGPVEGRDLVALTHDNGVTIGDLLVLPAMLFAALLVAIEAVPRVRRAHIRPR